ncbi:MAG TPA: acyl carrier protein [Myxococcota bacterium]|jgi:acyl carrier protein|nr:acyl carrier protein [Myxococcota bacterium]HRY92033.1 acyl carrier protein [Myxococcota bacterium]HSA21080.1 acyl carrier protein [Myxococcota bacterium]
MNPVEPKTLGEIRDLVLDYFADECDIDRGTISDETDIIRDLEGDSLMLLALLEMFRKKYGLTVELKSLGKHLMKRPARTVGQVVSLTAELVRHGNDILSVEL